MLITIGKIIFLLCGIALAVGAGSVMDHRETDRQKLLQQVPAVLFLLALSVLIIMIAAFK